MGMAACEESGQGYILENNLVRKIEII
jgi:hypothetical protein